MFDYDSPVPNLIPGPEDINISPNQVFWKVLSYLLHIFNLIFNFLGNFNDLVGTLYIFGLILWLILLYLLKLTIIPAPIRGFFMKSIIALLILNWVQFLIFIKIVVICKNLVWTNWEPAGIHFEADRCDFTDLINAELILILVIIILVLLYDFFLFLQTRPHIRRTLLQITHLNGIKLGFCLKLLFLIRIFLALLKFLQVFLFMSHIESKWGWEIIII